MKIGDVVIPARGSYWAVSLHSGCSRYPCAIVASMDPFVLVSVDGDMRWSLTVQESDFVALCQASTEVVQRAIARWQYDKTAMGVSTP
jgi:hypothetical protein